MADVRYTSRSMRRRCGTDKWEVTLSHTNPITGETIRTFRDLRHTVTTMTVAKGADVRTVASHLGHTCVTMVLDTYTDVDPDARRAVVSKVEKSFDVDFTTSSARQPRRPSRYLRLPTPWTSWRPFSPKRVRRGASSR